MTVQIRDRFESQDGSIYECSAHGIFKPADFGLNPRTPSTACYRGYRATLAVWDGQLFLKNLDVYLGNRGPEINSVTPYDGSGMESFDNCYFSVDHPLDFFGTLTIRKGRQSEFEYRTVCELKFVKGMLQDVRDVSLGIEERVVTKQAMARQGLVFNYFTSFRRTSSGGRTRLHVGHCRFCADGTYPLPDGTWHGPFSSLTEGRARQKELAAEKLLECECLPVNAPRFARSCA